MTDNKYKITIKYTGDSSNLTIIYSDEIKTFEKWICSDIPVYQANGNNTTYILKQNVCYVQIEEINI